jgi:hypothetical protein
VLRELVALAYSSIDDVMTHTNKDGLTVKPFQQWPDRIKRGFSIDLMPPNLSV